MFLLRAVQVSRRTLQTYRHFFNLRHKINVASSHACQYIVNAVLIQWTWSKMRVAVFKQPCHAGAKTRLPMQPVPLSRERGRQQTMPGLDVGLNEISSTIPRAGIAVWRNTSDGDLCCFLFLRCSNT